MPGSNKRRSQQPADVAPFVEGFLREWNKLTPEQRADFDRQLDEPFPGGFDERDEANALIAMAVRNGPIEDLHAGKRSPLLEDSTLSRITDAEMKTLMVHATRTLAALLRFRAAEPELYARWLRAYGTTYCARWERES